MAIVSGICQSRSTSSCSRFFFRAQMYSAIVLFCRGRALMCCRPQPLSSAFWPVALNKCFCGMHCLAIRPESRRKFTVQIFVILPVTCFRLGSINMLRVFRRGQEGVPKRLLENKVESLSWACARLWRLAGVVTC